jgi:hypothetical protein
MQIDDTNGRNRQHTDHTQTTTIKSRWDIVANPMKRNRQININQLVAALLFWMQKGDSTTQLLAKTDQHCDKKLFLIKIL